MLRLLALGLLAAAATGCAPNRADLAPPGLPRPGGVAATPADGKAAADTLRIGLGQQAAWADQTVRFEAVEEDSRCPAHTTCVWQGRARVRVAVGVEAAVLTLDSADGESLEATALTGTARVTLVSLDPYPGTDDTGRAPVATLVVAAP